MSVFSDYLYSSAFRCWEDDRSKTNMIGKIITCMKTGKVLVLVIGRLVQHFDISLLEAVTIACITLTYSPVVFGFASPTTKEENWGKWNWVPERSFEFWLHDFEFFFCFLQDFDDTDKQLNRVTHPTLFVQFGILCSAFSSIHSVAWNYVDRWELVVEDLHRYRSERSHVQSSSVSRLWLSSVSSRLTFQH